MHMKRSYAVKKSGSVRRLVLNRETLTTLEMNNVAGGSTSGNSCANISSCAQNCSDVSVCWANQVKPLCA
jgi:hypothetical protein